MTVVQPTAAPAQTLGTVAGPAGPPFELTGAQRLAGVGLAACLAVVYSGVERYFYVISRPLQYGFDGLMLAATLACLWSSRRSRLLTLALVPYLAWIVGFHLWGYAVSPSQVDVLPGAAGAVALNLLLLTAVAAAAGVRGGLQALVSLLQVAALANVGLALWETGHRDVTFRLAALVQSGYYNALRPAGLWIQPNDAAMALLFALIVSLFARRPAPAWIWLARAASLVGIYLSGSRSGLYPLVACLALFAVARLRSIRPGAGAWAALLLAGAVLVACLALLVELQAPALRDLTGGYDVGRFADLAQADRTPSDPSRTSLAGVWLDRAVNGPWQGSGLYSFRSLNPAVQGAHDVFIAIWGEAGLGWLVAYLAVLGASLAAFVRARLPARDRAALGCFWLVYVLEGLVDHSQLSSVVLIIVVGLLLALPAALESAGAGVSTSASSGTGPGRSEEAA
jgi:hypothetical protein